MYMELKLFVDALKSQRNLKFYSVGTLKRVVIKTRNVKNPIFSLRRQSYGITENKRKGNV